jgi:hypothetical protein
MTEQEELMYILKYDYFYPKKIVYMIDEHLEKVSPHSHREWFECDENETNQKECYLCKTHFLYITVHWSEKENSTVVSIFNHKGDFGHLFSVKDYPKENLLPVIEEVVKNVNTRERAKEYFSESERG